MTKVSLHQLFPLKSTRAGHRAANETAFSGREDQAPRRCLGVAKRSGAEEVAGCANTRPRKAMNVTHVRHGRVFSAGGHCFTWVEVIEAARGRGDWAALQHHVLKLLARERELAAVGALPSAAEVRAAAAEFRSQHKLLTKDELEEWLHRRDVTVEEWMGEMRRSLLEPAENASAISPEVKDRASWVHAACSGKLAAYAQTLAEEVAVHLSEQPLTLAPGELAALPEKRDRFCLTQLSEPALIAEIDDNKLGWIHLDLRVLIHHDEMVAQEAALCVRMDSREMADVAADAGARLQERSLLLDDAEPILKTRLLAAAPGDLIGPLAIASDHQLMLVVRRVPPSLDDAMVRRRAEETIINRALSAEVNRHVNWHERF